jgi:hypothetical protein
MMRLKTIASLLALCGVAALLTGCGGDDDTGPSSNPAPSGPAPASLRLRSYTLAEAAGATTLSFGANADTYILTRAATAPENGSYTPTKMGNDTWDLTLNNSTNGAVSRLILTFTGSGVGEFAYTPANGALVTGTFQSVGSNNGGDTNTGGDDNGSNNIGGAPTAAPARLSQIVLTGNPGNPAGGGQTVINITGSSFAYAAGGFSGTVLYTPSGNTAHLRLTYAGTATGDVDDYTLQFMAPSGSPTKSTFSGTQKVGSAAPAPASGTFTYTQ